MIDCNYTERLSFVKKFLKENDAKLIAHYYVDAEIQKLGVVLKLVLSGKIKIY